ncbi:MAG TPA: NADH-quinone oxidoreductase subunit NuoH [Polyangiaceae bacterium]|jgi:NADH-quinone oxidoreductase subunit H|nr:NADH-quinone oxidoreductase subunit NuoH [Polyangiaceae bacterium]
MSELLAQQPWLLDAFWLVFRCVAVFGVLLFLVAYTVLLERRVAAWIQDRIGPNRVGPFGLLQPLADAGKLMLKEAMLPSYVHKFYYLIAPVLVVIPAILVAGVIPWGSKLGDTPCVLADMDVGLLFVFAVTSLAVYGIALAGWASNSKYPLLGGVRSSAQMISYEVCLSLSVVGVLLQTQTMNLGKIVQYQADHTWLVLTQPFGFLIFLVSAFAETNRLPFDFPEAEQELVAGYHTEYSGMKFALFQLGEYANLIASCSLVVTLFFGGWSLPLPGFNEPASNLLLGILHVGVFLTKVGFLAFTFMWVRWTLPRFRYDQLMRLCWNVMVPMALVNMLVTAGVIAYWS